MMRIVIRLAANRTGAAAAEMALAMPLLIILMISTFELGHYFLSEHVVQKSVRDAARYASRLPMSNYPGCTPTAAAETQIQRVARTGRPDGTVQRLQGWTSDAMTTVSVTCLTGTTYTGIYVDFPAGVPIVTVSAVVPYPSLFGVMGIDNVSLAVTARSQSAVFGA